MLIFQKTIQPPKGTKWEVVYKNGSKWDRVQFCFVAIGDALYVRDGFRKPYFFVKVTGWKDVDWLELSMEFTRICTPDGVHFWSDLYDAVRQVYKHYGLPDNAFVVPILKPLIPDK